TTGLACIIAAIIGGGLKAFGVEIAVLRSWKRQALLALFGAMLTAAAYIIQGRVILKGLPVDVLFFAIKNSAGLLDTPPRLAEFTISKPCYVTSIWDYHWNQGRGATPGNVMLRRSDGTIYGPWEVLAPDRPSMQNWECKPRTSIPAGTYTIVDSDHATWSWNEKSNKMGMSKVKGYPVK